MDWKLLFSPEKGGHSGRRQKTSRAPASTRRLLLPAVMTPRATVSQCKSIRDPLGSRGLNGCQPFAYWTWKVPPRWRLWEIHFIYTLNIHLLRFKIPVKVAGSLIHECISHWYAKKCLNGVKWVRCWHFGPNLSCTGTHCNALLDFHYKKAARWLKYRAHATRFHSVNRLYKDNDVG